MPKRVKKSRKYKRKLTSKSNRKSRRINFRGGHGDKIQCCMCEKLVNKDDTLVPNECLIKNGKVAHRICQPCWWDPDTGFAREESSHKCPGCVKGLPLTPYVKETPITIDLTED